MWQGLTLEGFKYPAPGLPPDGLRTAGLTVSNEIKELEARITLAGSNLLILMTKGRVGAKYDDLQVNTV